MDHGTRETRYKTILQKHAKMPLLDRGEGYLMEGYFDINVFPPKYTLNSRKDTSNSMHILICISMEMH